MKVKRKAGRTPEGKSGLIISIRKDKGRRTPKRTKRVRELVNRYIGEGDKRMGRAKSAEKGREHNSEGRRGGGKPAGLQKYFNARSVDERKGFLLRTAKVEEGGQGRSKKWEKRRT